VTDAAAKGVSEALQRMSGYLRSVSLANLDISDRPLASILVGVYPFIQVVKLK